MLQKATLSIPSCHQLSLFPQPKAGRWHTLPPSRPGCQVTGDCVAMHSCCKHTSAVQLTAWPCTAAASTQMQLHWLWPCTAAVSIWAQLFCHGQRLFPSSPTWPLALTTFLPHLLWWSMNPEGKGRDRPTYGGALCRDLHSTSWPFGLADHYPLHTEFSDEVWSLIRKAKFRGYFDIMFI